MWNWLLKTNILVQINIYITFKAKFSIHLYEARKYILIDLNFYQKIKQLAIYTN